MMSKQSAAPNMTNQMKESLDTLRASLLCPICNELMEDTSMINCGHSFCHGCIIAYTCDNWNCPVVGCNMPVSAGRSRGTSYVKKNSQIESVISALLTIEQNIANAPDKWWIKKDDDKQSAVQFEEEGGEEEIFIDFQQMETCQEDSKEDDDASSTTKDIEEPKGTGEHTPDKGGQPMNLDSSLFNSATRTNRERVSCNVPPLFSQQFSPISVKPSQHSEQPSGVSDGRKTATASQMDEFVKKFGSSIMPESEQKTATSSEIAGAFLSAKSPHSSAKNSTTPKSTEDKQKSPREAASDIKSRRSPRVSFQPRPKVMLLSPSWTLKPADARCIRKCIADGNITMLSKYPTSEDLDFSFDFESESGRNAFLKALSCHREENPTPTLSWYAISTEKDYATDEGVVVPRSFQYYLAVACGMPIIDVGFLSTFTSRKKKGSPSHQYPFPCSPTTGKDMIKEEEKKYHVIGATDYSWNAPQKAASAASERHQSWLTAENLDGSSDTLLPGTGLLRGYDVLLLGEFEHSSSSPRESKAKKQKHNKAEVKKTRGNINLLLQLCGARVYDVESATTMKQLKSKISTEQCNSIGVTLPVQEGSPTLKALLSEYANESEQETQLVAIVKDDGCIKFAKEFLAEYFSQSNLPSTVLHQISIVTCDWLLDSLGEFEVKEISA